MKNLINYDLTTQTLPKLKECFELNGSPKEVNKIKWQYFENPEKSNHVEISYDENAKKTAGIYAVFNVKFKIGDNEFVGVQSLDTLVDLNYRGIGLFKTLAKNVYDKVIKSDRALVYGFPNGNSIHGFKKNLKWEVLDPIPFLIKPLRSKYFTDKVKFLKFLPNLKLSFSRFKNENNCVIRENIPFPKEVNVLWDSFSSNFEVAVVRNQEYLNWRYSKPGENYQTAHYYNNDGDYLGYIIYVVKEKHGGKIGYIMELIFDTNMSNIGEKLLNFAIHKINKKKADCILAWSFEHSPNYISFKNKRFLKMPEKIRPIELHFGVRSFKDDFAKLLYDRKNWYLSYSDSDTV